MRYELIVIGVSAGGLAALSTILPHLTLACATPILIVQHRGIENTDFFVDYLNSLCPLHVIEAIDKALIKPGTIMIAPPDYHMLVENKHTVALSKDPKVNYSRPSIDVLFESAADAFGHKVIGVILTGANSDGVKGAQKIKAHGGYIIVQNPDNAEAKVMPTETIKAVHIDKVVALNDIGALLNQIAGPNEASQIKPS